MEVNIYFNSQKQVLLLITRLVFENKYYKLKSGSAGKIFGILFIHFLASSLA
mgnify:CR=1 FL=1